MTELFNRNIKLIITTEYFALAFITLVLMLDSIEQGKQWEAVGILVATLVAFIFLFEFLMDNMKMENFLAVRGILFIFMPVVVLVVLAASNGARPINVPTGAFLIGFEYSTIVTLARVHQLFNKKKKRTIETVDGEELEIVD